MTYHAPVVESAAHNVIAAHRYSDGRTADTGTWEIRCFCGELFRAPDYMAAYGAWAWHVETARRRGPPCPSKK